MFKFLPVFLIVAGCHCCFLSNAQNSALNCGNGRYTNDVFTTVTKTQDIIFGYNTITDYTTNTVNNVTLRLDFYEPTGDVAAKRPLIILAFGGSFIGGQRSDMDAACTALAKKGYTTATIDYRLIQPGTNNSNINLVYSNQTLLADHVVKTTGDMKAAIRFFKHNAATSNTLKIDTSKIFIGGFSAGAIVALQTAYIDDINENPSLASVYTANGGLEGNTDLLAPNSLLPTYNAKGIAGVLNIAGGIVDTSLINATNPPVFSAQGDADAIIPYNYGNASFSPISLYGSYSIRARANSIGLPNQLFTIAGGNHESPVNNPYFSQVITNATVFFEPLICTTSVILPVELTSFTATSDNCTAALQWQTASEQNISHFDIEISDDGNSFSKIGTVPAKNNTRGSSYTYQYQKATGTQYFRLKLVDRDGHFTYSSLQKLKLNCAAVQIYPNPAKTFTTITGLQPGMLIQLLNAEGRLLWTQKANSPLLQIPLSAVANGLYILKVVNKQGEVITYSRLIKQ
jgi:acetyl esterase/lipase